MFIRNATKTFQSFSVGKVTFKLGPAGSRDSVTMMPDSMRDDPVVSYLLSKGRLVESATPEPEQKKAEPKAEVAKPSSAEKKPEKLKVVSFERNTTKQNIMVPCAATKQNGEQCGVNVSVPVGEYDESKPAFCKRHRNENPEDYERVDGGWRKKGAVKPESDVDVVG